MQNRLLKLKNTNAEDISSTEKVEFLFLTGMESFPLVIKPRFPGLILSEWIKENKEIIEKKLNQYGAILFRGFNIDSVDKFQGFIDTFNVTPLEYKHRSSPRFEVAKNIYHSTVYPADQSINMHSENSYAHNWAMKIAFCCIQPAEEQGETPIADNRRVLEYLSSDTKGKFLANGVRYTRNISKGLGLSWQEVFQTQNKLEVERECKNNGMEYKWVNEDRIILSWNNKAIYDHPVNGEKVWFNHAFFFNKYALDISALAAFDSDEELPYNTSFGDGSEITREEVEEIREAYKRSTIKFLWQKGDVLYMDNMMMSHGRSPYKGDRKIIVSMF